MNEFRRGLGFFRAPASVDEVPPELARSLNESIEDLRQDRTEDIGKFLEKMQAKVKRALVSDAEAEDSKR